ncbi:hypothetical protein MCOR25_000040 [Pyricularia grisea]|nr:hypothetical protein MCOR25_000040 [Pyricularia grisea]
MRLSIGASFLAFASAHAFSDSSPFVFLSTAQIARPSTASTAQLQSSSQVLSTAKSMLESCPTERYLLISQPNAHASDLRCAADHPGCRKAPNLVRYASSDSPLSVAEVFGSLSFGDFADHIKASCMQLGKTAHVVEHTLKELPTSKGPVERAAALEENDRELGNILDTAHDQGDYTAIYFSNPNDFKPYESGFDDSIHMELKRQLVDTPLAKPRAAGKVSDNSTGHHDGLFHRYQFFTPGIFMGLLAMFLMMTILYVGLQALGSLQVPYGAFEKDMGPAAQRKNQ